MEHKCDEKRQHDTKGRSQSPNVHIGAKQKAVCVHPFDWNCSHRGNLSPYRAEAEAQLNDNFSQSGTYTILFTDIASSSPLWESFPEQMAVDVRSHNHLVRTAAEATGGFVFKSLGDGLGLIFHTPQTAIGCALDILVQSGQREWATPSGLQMKIGIHTGVVQPLDGDFQGPAINRLARIMEVLRPGQLLVSGTAYELARDYLAPGLEWVLVGKLPLRGSQYQEEVFQPVGEGLPAATALTISTDWPPPNLPRLPFKFVGREHERLQIREHFQKAGGSIATIVGFGGAGKTSLANVVAWDCLGDFNDRVLWVDCESMHSRKDLVEAILRACGEADSADAEQGILEALADQKTLLVCDCFESMVLHARVLESLVQRLPGLSILVTSRIVLGVPSEHLFDLSDRSKHSAKEVTADAIAIFTAAAERACPNFRLPKNQLPLLRKLLAKLEYLPLAIVICAGRLRYSGLDSLFQQVSEQLLDTVKVPRLEGGRHAGLRVIIDSSFRLIPTQDLVVADALSYFEGGFTLDAVLEVAGKASSRDALLRLIDHSLIQLDQTGHEPRYKMLDSVREYLKESEARCDRVAVQVAHCKYYFSLAAHARTKFEELKSSESAEMIAHDLANLRAAFESCASRKDFELLKHFALQLSRLLLEFGYLTDFDWLTESALRLPEGTLSPRECTELYGLKASAARRGGDLPSAIIWIQKQAQHLEEAGDQELLRESWIDLAAMWLQSGEPMRAQDALAAYAASGGDQSLAYLALMVRADPSKAAGLVQEIQSKVDTISPMEAIFVTQQLALAAKEVGAVAECLYWLKQFLHKCLAADHIAGTIVCCFLWTEVLKHAGRDDDQQTVLSALLQLKRRMTMAQRRQLLDLTNNRNIPLRKENWRETLQLLLGSG